MKEQILSRKMLLVVTVFTVLIILFLQDSKGKAFLTLFIMFSWGVFYQQILFKRLKENFSTDRFKFKPLASSLFGVSHRRDLKQTKVMKVLFIVGMSVFLLGFSYYSIQKENTTGTFLSFGITLLTLFAIIKVFYFVTGQRGFNIESVPEKCSRCGTTDPSYLSMGYAPWGICGICAQDIDKD